MKECVGTNEWLKLSLCSFQLKAHSNLRSFVGMLGLGLGNRNNYNDDVLFGIHTYVNTGEIITKVKRLNGIN